VPTKRAKPRGLSSLYAEQFRDPSVVAAYAHRPPYAPEVCDVLERLIGDRRPRAVLELGCGRGEIARALAPRVDRIDAIDASAAMIERGRALAGGEAANLRWIVAPAETATLSPPYAMAVAASSLHWMDWDVVLPRVAAALAPGAVLAVFNDDAQCMPWDDALRSIIPRYSTNREFQPYDLIEELTTRGLFEPLGMHVTTPVPFAQRVEDYVEAFHSRNGFSRDRMTGADADAFDAAVGAAVSSHATDGWVTLRVYSKITWGRPLAGSAS
jgi:SAM-dependent methyltransferase